MKNIYQAMYLANNKVDLAKNPRVQVMLEIINDLNLENKNILDIGCYDGTLLSLVKNQNNNFYGLDASAYGLSECIKKNIQARQFFWDDSAPLPYPDDFFDLVVAGEIIEHIYDTDYFLNEIHRLLKPSGVFLVSTPNLASLGRRLFLFFGKNPLIEPSLAPGNAGHIRYFTRCSLMKLLAENNLGVIKIRSDVVNFSSTGRPQSILLAGIFPGFGQSIICLCKK